MNTQKKPKFSICMPIYKNEKNLPVTISYIVENLHLFSNYDVEIVMVNDGSPDNSYEIMKDYQKQYPDLIKIASLTRNFGQVACINACYSIASGDVIGVISADLQEPFELFVDMLKEWEKGYKIVIGSREKRKDRGIAALGGKILHRLIHKYIEPRYPVGGFDFFILDKEVKEYYTKIDKTSSSMQLKLLYLGYKMKEIKYTRNEREIGKSGWTIGGKIHTGIQILCSFSKIPIYLFLSLGIFIWILSVIGLLCTGILYAVHILSTVAHIIIALLLLNGIGVLLITQGIVIQYLWLNMDLGREFPRYVLEEEHNE